MILKIKIKMKLNLITIKKMIIKRAFNLKHLKSIIIIIIIVLKKEERKFHVKFNKKISKKGSLKVSKMTLLKTRNKGVSWYFNLNDVNFFFQENEYEISE